jgi:hypothetical protein
MSISLTFRFPPGFTNPAAGTRQTSAAALPIHLARQLANIRKRGAERRMVKALERLGHPGLIADLHQARRG